MDIKANHLRLTGACLLDSNVNKLHKTYALGMMHKQQFIEHSSGMLPKYIWVLIPFLVFCFMFYWKKDSIKLSQWVCNHEWSNSIWNWNAPLDLYLAHGTFNQLLILVWMGYRLQSLQQIFGHLIVHWTHNFLHKKWHPKV